MVTPRKQAFEELQLDHVELYLRDIDAPSRRLVERYGFEVYAVPDAGSAAACRTAGVGREQIRLLLTTSDHSAAGHLAERGEGVTGSDRTAAGDLAERNEGIAGLGLRVSDAAAAYAEAVRRGATPLSAPTEEQGVIVASIGGATGVTHTFVQRPPGADPRLLPGLVPTGAASGGWDSGLVVVDHIGFWLEPDERAAAATFYQDILDFDLVFEAKLPVASEVATSTVVQSRSGAVMVALHELTASALPSALEAVSQVAFGTNDIVRTAAALASRGGDLLGVTPSFYREVGQRLRPVRHRLDELQAYGIAVDHDQDGQLFQLLTRPVPDVPHLYVEVIERIGAQTLGPSSLAALYRTLYA